MPSFKGQLTDEADRRRDGVRRQGDRRQPERLSLSLPDDFPRDVRVVATDFDRTLTWMDGQLHERTLAALARTKRGGPARDRRHRPDGAVGAARDRAGGARRSGDLLPGRRRHRRRVELAAARADPARAGAGDDRRRARRGLPAERVRRRRALRRVRDATRRATTRTSSRIEFHVVGDLLGWLSKPPTKLVCVGDPAELDGVEVRMREQFGGPPPCLEVAAVLPRVRAPRA